jgi:hypothetical protein
MPWICLRTGRSGRTLSHALRIRARVSGLSFKIDYSVTCCDSVGPVSMPVVFNHIPKTAGTSLTNALMDALGTKRVRIAVDSFSLGSSDALASLDRSARRLIITRPAQLPSDVDLVAGHLTPSTTRERYPGAQDLTVLREARSRLLSSWLFSRAHTDRELRHLGDFADLVRRARNPLTAYLSDPAAAAHTDNVMLRFLVWPHPLIRPDRFISASHHADLLELARDSLRLLSHVDTIESPGFATDLSNWLGAEVRLSQRNQSPPIPSELRPDLTVELRESGRDLLAERTVLDQTLWTEVFRSRSPDIVSQNLADATFERAVDRYSTQLAQPVPAQPALSTRSLRKLRRRAHQWRTTRV